MAGAHDPLAAAGSWWMVSGTLIDLGCLLALSLLVRREGIRLLDLIQVDRSRIGREVLLGFGIVLLVVPALAINAALTVVFYGSKLPPQVALVHLPLWATVYSIVVWPVIWGFTEETYLQRLLASKLGSADQASGDRGSDRSCLLVAAACRPAVRARHPLPDIQDPGRGHRGDQRHRALSVCDATAASAADRCPLVHRYGGSSIASAAHASLGRQLTVNFMGYKVMTTNTLGWTRLEWHRRRVEGQTWRQ